MISVQRLDDLIVPRLFWFDFSVAARRGHRQHASEKEDSRGEERGDALLAASL